ncbi:hypothetical protein QAD02_015434 [Eretmocerus hayati]|uniref:Uncharacterized protein n=1 Tax=Eretmocerus hayati TaxID=131215 RepID=A0ACC2PB06_9HYME|nr:hypothetical protein QAD02_015434 [Eretmocerus hayati]
MEDPIEIKYWLEDPTSEAALNECERAAKWFEKASCLIARDPRVSEEDNNKFLDMMERYFEQDEKDKLVDARPECHYQIGVTPEGKEFPRCAFDPSCHELIKELNKNPANSAHLPTKPDAKWRFFHRVGPRPKSTKFAELNADPVCPAAIPEFLNVMDSWGKKLLETSFTLSEMIAVGFGLPRDAFTKLMDYGPHLLAPTGSDLKKHGTMETILAGFHRDLSFITCHGKSRFPGLDIWLRDGTKFPVSIPDGCILAQAGMELEHLTGGRVIAGWHEVWVNDKTLAAIERAKQSGKSLWRISSTLFAHIASDVEMSPLVGTEEEISAASKKYPKILAGHHVENELQAINLKNSR